MREFHTAAKREAESEVFDNAEPLDIKIDDDEFTLLPPTPEQMAFIMVRMEGKAGQQIAGLIDFLDSMLDEDDQERFHERLLDRNDNLTLDTVQEMVSYAMEEWSGRPTGSSAGSTPSRASSGSRSTGKPRSKAVRAS